MPTKARRIITLDGPAGAGKTSVSRRVAGELALAYLDTGAMFRGLALRLGPQGHLLPEAVIDTALAALVFSLSGCGRDTRLLINGEALPDAARTEEVGARASKLAALPVVRRRLKLAQQALGRETDLLAEGRDMGTAVFPEAAHKFFLDASPEVRAARRVRQLAALGRPEAYETILAAIRSRDHEDRNRLVAPLCAAPDAQVIDTSAMTEDAVVARIVAAVGA